MQLERIKEAYSISVRRTVLPRDRIQRVAKKKLLSRSKVRHVGEPSSANSPEEIQHALKVRTGGRQSDMISLHQHDWQMARERGKGKEGAKEKKGERKGRGGF